MRTARTAQTNNLNSAMANPIKKTFRNQSGPQQARQARVQGALRVAAERAPDATPTGRPLFSVIVCTLNGARVLPACLASLLANHGVTFEVIVVDNGSTDATAQIARGFAGVRLIRAGQNLGFAGGNNLGLLAARGEYLVLLNDDTETPPDWLAHVAAGFARHERIGAVGCKLVYPNKRPANDPRERVIQHAGGVLLANGNTGHAGVGEPDRGQWNAGRECDYVTGAALALRRAALVEVGLLDPAFFPIYYEEVDLQTRLREAGWKIWYEPAAWLVHYESQTQGAGSPMFVYRYTRCRMRYLALHGCPGGKWCALAMELPWLWRITFAGRLWPVLKAYVYGVRHWRGWRNERATRPTVGRL